MKKSILTVAIALMMGLGFSATAANARPDNDNTTRTEQRDSRKDKKDKKDRKDRKDKDNKDRKDKKECRGDKREICKGDMKGLRNAVNQDALNGIELTEDQKTAINALNEQNAQQAKARAEQKRQERKDAADQKRIKLEDRREQLRADRRQVLDQLKQILTPEQYTMYLENIVVENSGAKPMMHGTRNHIDRHDREHTHHNTNNTSVNE